MKNIKIEFTNACIIPALGLAVVGAVLSKSDFVKRCSCMDVIKNRFQHLRNICKIVIEEHYITKIGYLGIIRYAFCE